MMRYRRMGVAILLAVAGMPLTGCESDELLKRQPPAGLNGGFEVTEAGIPVNWSFFPNPGTDSTIQVSVDSEHVLEGRQSLRVIKRPGDRLPAIRSRQIAVESGRDYRLSVSVRNEGCSLKVNRIVQDASGKTNVRSDNIIDTSASSTEWETFDETLSVAEGETQVLLIFLIDGSGTLWIDDVKLEAIAG